MHVGLALGEEDIRGGRVEYTQHVMHVHACKLHKRNRVGLGKERERKEQHGHRVGIGLVEEVFFFFFFKLGPTFILDNRVALS